jgi:hypothetical protein
MKFDQYNTYELEYDPVIRKILNQTYQDMKRKRELEFSYQKKKDHRRCNNCHLYFHIDDTVVVQYSSRSYRVCYSCVNKVGGKVI